MQDMRMFNCGIDRRLRTNSAINHQQALKCPRCDSVNTKFCYYNNYNMSQPRYYCKACRRYWTKGGVLRNVPVGGAIRKAKRSAKTKKSTSSVGAKSADSNSSSERSSLTATTATPATEVVSARSSLNSCPNVFQFPVPPEITQPAGGFNHQNFIDPDSSGSLFTEMGQFTEIMTSSNDLGFNIADTTNFTSENQNDDQVQQMQNNRTADELYLDQTTGIDSKEWHVDDQGMFDLTGNVDEAYWSQNQWPDHSDHSFHFHLP